MDAAAIAGIEDVKKAFAAFQKANDERLAQIEKKGSADPLLVEQVEKINQAVTELQKQAGRRGATAEAEAEGQEQKAAFNLYIRKGRTDLLDALHMKAVNLGTDSEGGYLVPQDLDKRIYEVERSNTPMRGVCEVMSVSNEAYERLVDVGETSSGWVGETEARTETTTPPLQVIRPSFGEIYAMPASTQKALDDAMIDVEAWLGRKIGLDFASKENTAFMSGNGINKPKGILSYTLSTSADGTRTAGQLQKVHSGSSGAFVTDKLIDIIHATKPGYRNGAAWMMSGLGVADVRKLKDDVNNYLWQPGLQAGQPSSLLGYPIIENDAVPAPAADANAALFGNFMRGYLIADVKGVTIIRDNLTQKPKVLFYTTKRLGGGVVDDYAIKVVTLSA